MSSSALSSGARQVNLVFIDESFGALLKGQIVSERAVDSSFFKQNRPHGQRRAGQRRGRLHVFCPIYHASTSWI
jgi:hypothetical protein